MISTGVGCEGMCRDSNSGKMYRYWKVDESVWGYAEIVTWLRYNNLVGLDAGC